MDFDESFTADLLAFFMYHAYIMRFYRYWYIQIEIFLNLYLLREYSESADRHNLASSFGIQPITVRTDVTFSRVWWLSVMQM